MASFPCTLPVKWLSCLPAQGSCCFRGSLSWAPETSRVSSGLGWWQLQYRQPWATELAPGSPFYPAP